MDFRASRIAALVALGLLATAARAADVNLVAKPVPIPGGSGGVRIDDFYFDRLLGKLVLPAGRTGQLDFVDPESFVVEALGGFPVPKKSTGTPMGGLTSADAGPGVVFATDRTDRKLYIIDGAARSILGSSALKAEPDYARYVASEREVWVTEPSQRQIEVLSISAEGGAWSASHEAVIVSSAAFEALAVDGERGSAYSNQDGDTLVIDLKSRQIVHRWPNGCKRARGLALDGTRGFLVVACDEGRAAVLDVAHDGKVLSALQGPDGLDRIAFVPGLAHVYLAGGKPGRLMVAALRDDGQLEDLGVVTTSAGAKRVAGDDRRGIWVADGRKGRLLYLKDPY